MNLGNDQSNPFEVRTGIRLSDLHMSETIFEATRLRSKWTAISRYQAL